MNWTLPNEYYSQNSQQMLDLPQPSGSLVYEGDPSEHVHASYSTPDGELQLFTVDDHVYDKNGYEVGLLQAQNYNRKMGFNERLILPMGDDCRRYAIIYRSALEGDGGGGTGQQDVHTLFMAIYDMDAVNQWNEDDPVIGALEDYNGDFQTVRDIGKRDGVPNYQAGLQLYGYTQVTAGIGRQSISNIQIAASDLIDGCYYRVYVFDGNNLIKYHLTDTDLEYQGVIQQVAETSLTGTLRSEMELIKLGSDRSSNYRLAIPTIKDEGAATVGIRKYDINGLTGA